MAAPGFGEIGEKLRRSTVQVRRGRNGCGSGVIWTGDGLIITNAHVAREGHGLSVELWDGRQFAADTAWRDDRRDLAALRIGTAGNLSAAEIGDSGRLRAGELAIAVGNPFGFAGALSTGVIHAVGAAPGLGKREWVQASVRLAPGNSGGPLADARGRVIGINTMIVNGLGLAIPSNAVAAFARGNGPRYTLGVTVRPVKFGLLVLAVAPDGAAQAASLLPGDLLVAANGGRLRDPDDLYDALEQANTGILELAFTRGDRAVERHVVVRLQAWSAAA